MKIPENRTYAGNVKAKNRAISQIFAALSLCDNLADIALLEQEFAEEITRIKEDDKQVNRICDTYPLIQQMIDDRKILLTLKQEY